jgi:hypothetical protein
MRRVVLSLVILLVFGVSISAGQNQTFVVTPTTPIFGTGGNHVVGVPLDSPPNFEFGSFKSDGLAKTDMYFPPEALFGREVKVGEVASLSYYTKKGLTHNVEPRDWYLVVYTKRYTGQLGSSFYGVRLGAEPYFASNMFDPPNEWNQWSSTGLSNQLRWFESTYGYFGGYGDPSWQTLVAGTSLAGSRGPGVPYATQPILYFSVQTASGWSAGFNGAVDGFEIRLNDGSTARINFEPFLVAADKDSCRKGGWQTLFRADGSGFKNQGDCVSYTVNGK